MGAKAPVVGGDGPPRVAARGSWGPAPRNRRGALTFSRGGATPAFGSKALMIGVDGPQREAASSMPAARMSAWAACPSSGLTGSVRSVRTRTR